MSGRIAESTAEIESWVVYDDFEGGLNEEAWVAARMPLPDGSFHHPLDPSAEVRVDAGVLNLHIPSFGLPHGEVQVFDNVKYLTTTARRFPLSKIGRSSFGCQLAVTNVAGEPLDVRSGMAAFVVVDPDETGRVFDICGTSNRVFAIHEQLAVGDGGPGFTHVVESPFADFRDDFTSFRECTITFDASKGDVEWDVDGELIYFLRGVDLPEAVRMGFGMFTLLPIRDGASQAIRGQGMAGRWRGFRTAGVPASEEL